MDNTVATTILAQLGGQRFKVMTGASSFAAGVDQLTFRLPSNLTRNKIKGVKITLTPADLYTMEFLAQKGRPTFKVVTVEKIEDVYCDQLAEIFERVTGLRTSL